MENNDRLCPNVCKSDCLTLYRQDLFRSAVCANRAIHRGVLRRLTKWISELLTVYEGETLSGPPYDLTTLLQLLYYSFLKNVLYYTMTVKLYPDSNMHVEKNQAFKILGKPATLPDIKTFKNVFYLFFNLKCFFRKVVMQWRIKLKFSFFLIFIMFFFPPELSVSFDKIEWIYKEPFYSDSFFIHVLVLVHCFYTQYALIFSLL